MNNEIVKTEYANRTEYTLNGNLHNTYGPAVVYSDGLKEYWINGKQIVNEIRLRENLWLNKEVDELETIYTLRGSIRKNNRKILFTAKEIQTIEFKLETIVLNCRTFVNLVPKTNRILFDDVWKASMKNRNINDEITECDESLLQEIDIRINKMLERFERTGEQ